MGEPIIQYGTASDNQSTVSTNRNAVKQIYQLRRNLIIIGVTGRTGSGCSTISKLLKTEKFTDFKSEYKEINDRPWVNESRKNRIVYQYMQHHWHPFIHIRISSIIFFYALLLNKEEFEKELEDQLKIFKKEFNIKFEDNDYNQLHEDVHKCNNFLNTHKGGIDAGYYTGVLEKIYDFRVHIVESLLLRNNISRAMIHKVMKTWANNIRRYNCIKEVPPTSEYAKEEAESRMGIKTPAYLAYKLGQFVEAINNYNKGQFSQSNSDESQTTYIVIDALRNPYEVLYFRENYAAFYLLSICTSEEIRRRQLIAKGYSLDEIDSVDKSEYEISKMNSNSTEIKRPYQDIDINKCIELSDIHIARDDTKMKENRVLINQLLTYIALIRHPGLIPPSPIERVMQVAYTAKLNSGCLSRQVGAAITNEDYSIQAIGWNTVPRYQTPCNLRNIRDLVIQEDENAYSDFERYDDNFQEAARQLNTKYKENGEGESSMGLPLCYCFKDVYNTQKGEGKNQIHTRSLHAEENAILQLAKYGSAGIKGGLLFTTSNCCELCAKKAYQLGIKKIYYIDNYPGISREHIIGCGSNRPEMIMFTGAIGRAYCNFYDPFLAYKDELEFLTEVKVSEVCKPKGNSISESKGETDGYR